MKFRVRLGVTGKFKFHCQSRWRLCCSVSVSTRVQVWQVYPAEPCVKAPAECLCNLVATRASQNHWQQISQIPHHWARRTDDPDTVAGRTTGPCRVAWRKEPWPGAKELASHLPASVTSPADVAREPSCRAVWGTLAVAGQRLADSDAASRDVARLP